MRTPSTRKVLVLCLTAALLAGLPLAALPAPVARAAASADDGFNLGTNGVVRALVAQADGKLVTGGAFTTLGGVARSRIGRLNGDGSLDTAFNPGTGGANPTIYALAEQADGKIVVGGAFTTLGGQLRSRIGRLNGDGSVDVTFNPGASGTGSAVAALLVQPDGKIVVGGSFTTLGGQPRSYIGRLNADGSLDTAFNPSADGAINALALQADGKIVVGGSFTTLGGQPCNHIGRLNADGSLDSAFGAGADGAVNALALQVDGKIVAGGSFTMLGGKARVGIGRLIPDDGSLDPAFNPGVGGAVPTVSVLAVQADGKLVVGGSFTTLDGQPRAGIGRLNLDGSLDTSFNPGADGAVNALALQTDGKIAVGGSFTTLGGQPHSNLGRLNGDGSSDTAFNPGVGDLYPFVYTVAVQADGKVLVGGGFTTLGGQPRSNLGRLGPDGSLDPSFNPGANGVVYALAVQADGKIVVGGGFTTLGGQTRNYLGRLNPNGSLETSFNPAANGPIYALALQADGKLVVGGSFTTLAGVARSNLGRLNHDGSLDISFNPGANGAIYALAVQADGKLVVGGAFTTLGGQTRNYLGRLNADGSLDTSFNPGANGAVNALAAQADGKLVVGGYFTTLGGASRSNIGRLNAAGSLDSAFDPGAGSYVNALVVQADGKIVVGGGFTTLGGQPRAGIGRLLADGAADADFDPGANSAVYALAVQADGRIIVGGFFTLLGGLPRSRLGRLSSDTPAPQALTTDRGGTTLTWMRSGASPEVARVTFEQSADGVTYTALGAGARIAGGWQLTGLALPPGQNLFLRACGHYPTGSGGNAVSVVEMVRNVYLLSTVYVDDSYSVSTPGWQYDHFATIGSGLEAVANGGTVDVAAGTYAESVALSRPVTITLSGDVALNGSLALDNGSFVAPTGTLTLSGNFTNNAGSSAFDANGGTVTFKGTRSIGGSSVTEFHNLTIASGAQLTAPSGALNVAGDWTNNGTFSHNNGTIVFDGMVRQTLSGNTIFNHLTINNGGAPDQQVDASGSALTVNGLLRVQNGIFRSASTLSDVQIDPGATLVAAGNMTVSGDWLNDGAFTPNGYTVTFHGTTIIGGAATTTFHDLKLGESLLGYWRLDEGGGATTADASGNGNTGTLTGGPVFDPIVPVPPIGFPDPFSLSFDGAAAHVRISNNAINRLANNFTVTAWIRPSSLSGVRRIISTLRTLSSNGWGFGTNDTGLRFTTFGRTDYNLSLTPGLTVGPWYHVAAVMDNANDVTFYVNGESRGTKYASVSANPDTDDALAIGATAGSGGPAPVELFAGLIDDVRVYGRALSAAEIAALAAGGPMVNLAAPLDVDGNLTLTGATLDVGGSGRHISLAGNLVNAGGNLNARSGLVTFDGSGVQSIAGATGFYSLTVSDGVTLTTASDVTVNGALINIGWIKETKSISGTAPFTRTFGLTKIAVGVNTLGGLSRLAVIRRDQNHPSAGDLQRTGRYWTMTSTGTGYTVTLTLPHNNVSEPQTCRYAGSAWDCGRSSFDATVVTRSNVTGFSDWAVSDASLPVAPAVGIIFDAGGAALTWLGNPVNSSGYEVWWSADPYFDWGDPGADHATLAAGQPTYTYQLAETPYYYLVVGRNAAGQRSLASNRVGKFDFTLAPGAPSSR